MIAPRPREVMHRSMHTFASARCCCAPMPSPNSLEIVYVNVTDSAGHQFAPSIGFRRLLSKWPGRLAGSGLKAKGK
jgi:hypothetical protein